MSSVIKQFKIFDKLNENVKESISCFYVSFDCETNLHYSLLVTKSDQVYVCGDNHHGRLMTGNDEFIEEHTQITKLMGEKINDFIDGGHCMFARNEKKEIYGWGDNLFGQLGERIVEDNNQYMKPDKFIFFIDKNIVQISCGNGHCLALSAKGTVYGWGDNSYGQIDNNLEDNSIKSPIPVNFDKTQLRAKTIHCYGNLSFVLKEDNIVIKFGDNQQKQIFEIQNCDSCFHCFHLDQILIIKNESELNFYSICEQETIYSSEDLFEISPKYFTTFAFTETIKVENKNLEKLRSKYIRIFERMIELHHFTPRTLFITSQNFIWFKGLTSVKLMTNSETKSYLREKFNILHIDSKDGYLEDNFHIVYQRIGSGAFGRVLKANDKKTGVSYAIKKIWTAGRGFRHILIRHTFFRNTFRHTFFDRI